MAEVSSPTFFLAHFFSSLSNVSFWGEFSYAEVRLEIVPRVLFWCRTAAPASSINFLLVSSIEDRRFLNLLSSAKTSSRSLFKFICAPEIGFHELKSGQSSEISDSIQVADVSISPPHFPTRSSPKQLFWAEMKMGSFDDHFLLRDLFFLTPTLIRLLLLRVSLLFTAHRFTFSPYVISGIWRSRSETKGIIHH